MQLCTWLSLAFIAIWAGMLQTDISNLATLFTVNAAAQLTLFTLVACIPFWRTQRISYVDIAWPFGVATIGLCILLFGEGDTLRRLVVAGVYLFIGLRMGVGAVVMAYKTGVIFKHEFPRYQYRHMVLEQSGTKHVKLHMLTEILTQGFANMSVLAIPGFLMAINPESSLSPWEIAGLLLWAAAYILESVADSQKLLFISRKSGDVCNIGLWKYSRHPNYFGEWLVWTGLVLATVPSWLAMQSIESSPVWWLAGVGAIGASVMMFITLVFLTGAIPAEYYSVQKRPGYREYQARTSIFFPWFPKKSTSA